MLVYFIPFFVFSFLAFLHSLKTSKVSNSGYLLGLLVLALMGGLRFETGMDWAVYQNYFSSINTMVNPVTSYTTNTFIPAFEIGYFYLNYFIKYLGGSCSNVFLMSTFFCSFAVYRFTSKFAGNKWYILCAFISFNFLYLYFATVRQAIAVGFFLIGCRYYLDTKKKFKSLLISSLGFLFHVSSLMYLILMIPAFYRKKGVRIFYMGVALLLVFFLLGSLHYFQFYQLIGYLFLPAIFAAKFESYGVGGEAISVETYIFGFCMVLYAVYIYRNRRIFKEYSVAAEFICYYAVNSLLMTFICMIMFHFNAAMWTRLFNVASIFQAFAITLVARVQRSRLSALVMLSGLIFNGILYYYFLRHGFQNLIPYKFQL